MDSRLTTLAPKEAIARAKAAVADLFGDENITGIRLEEIRFDDGKEHWMITVGFERPSSTADLQGLFAVASRARSYKVVTIQDGTGQVLSVTNWSAEAP